MSAAVGSMQRASLSPSNLSCSNLSLHEIWADALIQLCALQGHQCTAGEEHQAKEISWENCSLHDLAHSLAGRQSLGHGLGPLTG